MNTGMKCGGSPPGCDTTEEPVRWRELEGVEGKICSRRPAASRRRWTRANKRATPVKTMETYEISRLSLLLWCGSAAISTATGNVQPVGLLCASLHLIPAAKHHGAQPAVIKSPCYCALFQDSHAHSWYGRPRLPLTHETSYEKQRLLGLKIIPLVTWKQSTLSN